MATLHVRNVPDELYELLRERAAANGRSIGAETCQLLFERLVAAAGRPQPVFSIPGMRRRPVGAPAPFTRFTAEARQAVVIAQREARALGHGSVGTEHLLLGVVAQEIPAAEKLGRLGLTPDAVRRQLKPGDKPAKGRLPFEPEAKLALEIALRESTKLGDTVIAPRSIVLGIVGAADSRGAAIVRAAEPDAAKLRTLLLGPGVPAPLRPTGPMGMPIDTSFHVILLEGDAADWERQLNAAGKLGYELVQIVDRHAIFRS